MRQLILFIFLCTSSYLSGQGLVINEFVASSDSLSGLMDDFGEYDDWVELHNNSNQSIDLNNYYFSDDIAEPDKWQFPSGVSIAANGYLVIWTDSDDEQGDLHTSFKLSKGGEQLVLSDDNMMVLDSLTFGEQETNVSMARIPNGTGDFTPRVPTFNQNNETSNINNLLVREDFDLYPNPANDFIQIDFSETSNLNNQEATIHILDATGKQVYLNTITELRQGLVINIDINTLASGIHFINIQTDREAFLRKIIVD